MACVPSYDEKEQKELVSSFWHQDLGWTPAYDLNSAMESIEEWARHIGLLRPWSVGTPGQSNTAVVMDRRACVSRGLGVDCPPPRCQQQTGPLNGPDCHDRAGSKPVNCGQYANARNTNYGDMMETGRGPALVSFLRVPLAWSDVVRKCPWH